MPGPKSFSGTSGKDGSTSFQFFTFESGPQIVASCSTVRQLAQSLSLFTTTVSASLAIWNSTYSMPLSLQIAASSSLIGREAFERSVSPRQKRSKPPPVPETPTVIWTSGFCCWKRSAAAVVYGPTVLEPSASIRPERSLPAPVAAVVVPAASSPPRPPPQPASRATRPSSSAVLIAFLVLCACAECSGGGPDDGAPLVKIP